MESLLLAAPIFSPPPGDYSSDTGFGSSGDANGIYRRIMLTRVDSAGQGLDTSYGISGLSTVELPNVFNTKVGTEGLTAASGFSTARLPLANPFPTGYTVVHDLALSRFW